MSSARERLRELLEIQAGRLFPFSEAQKAMWLHEQLLGDRREYVWSHCLASPLGFHPSMVRQLFRELTARHPVLLARVQLRDDGQPWMRLDVDPEQVFRAVPESVSSEEQLQQRLEELCGNPMDLEQGPLFQAYPLSCEVPGQPARSWLLLKFHHLIMDWWSFSLLLEDIVSLIMSYLNFLPSPPEPGGARYADFVRWQTDYLQSPQAAPARRYWKKTLEALTLRPSPGAPVPLVATARTLRFHLDARQTEAIRDRARRLRVTPHSLTLTALAAVLARNRQQLSDEETTVWLTVPAAGRPRREFERIVGPLFNPLLFGARFGEPDASWDETVRAVHDQFQECLQHQDYPWHHLLSDLPAHDRLRPLSPDVLFCFQSSSIQRYTRAHEDRRVAIREVPTGCCGTDLSLHFWDGPQFQGCWTYRQGRYRPDEVAALNRTFLETLQTLVQDADQSWHSADVPLADPGGLPGRTALGLSWEAENEEEHSTIARPIDLTRAPLEEARALATRRSLEELQREAWEPILWRLPQRQRLLVLPYHGLSGCARSAWAKILGKEPSSAARDPLPARERLRFWKAVLSPPEPESSCATAPVGRRSLPVPPELPSAVDSFCERYGVEPDSLWLASALALYAQVKDCENVACWFCNWNEEFPLRLDLPPESSFALWAQTVQAARDEARRHLPVALKPQTSVRWPSLRLVTGFPRQIDGPGGQALPTLLTGEESEYALTLIVEPPGLRSEAHLDALEPRWLDAWLRLTSAGLTAPERPVGELPLLSDAEQKWLDQAGTGPPLSWPSGTTLNGRLHAGLQRAAQRVLLEDADRRWTGAELEARVCRLASALRMRGVGSGDRVAWLGPRSFESVWTTLAIWRIGATYVPLEEDWGEAGVAAVLRTVEPRLTVTSSPRWEQQLQALSCNAEGLDLAWDEVTSSPYAYLLHTSGSSGRPKAVLGTEHGLLNRIAWNESAFPWGPDEAVTHKTDLGFVDSLWELTGPLAAGVRLVVLGEEAGRRAERLARTVQDSEVSRLVLVPALLEALLGHAERLGSLRFLVSSGEILAPALAAEVLQRLPDVRLLNLFGSTEVSGDVSWFEVAAGCESVPIGRPLANVTLRVVNSRGRRVPPGVGGELSVAGAPVNDLWGEAPVEWLRTGDRVRWREDGVLEYLGRADRQVKLGGVRCHLDGLEQALRAHPGVAEAAVVLEDGRRLLGFYQPHDPGQAPSADELTQWLETRALSVPERLLCVDQLPRLASGKLDRQALRTEAFRWERPVYVAPERATEKLLSIVWEELLHVEPVGLEDNFFALGGHSMLAADAVYRIEQILGIDLTLRTFFEATTLRQLSEVVLSLSPQAESLCANLLSELGCDFELSPR